MDYESAQALAAEPRSCLIRS